jgi:hypothetical protein
MRVLFVGDIAPYQTTEARRDAFIELGVPLEAVDQRALLAGSDPRLTFWTLLTPGVFAFNREILRRAESFRPDVVWIEKGVYVFPRTLRALHRDRKALLVYHNTDDWRGKVRPLRVHWRYLLREIRRYDVHITSNWYNAEEFRRAGFPRVHHMELAAHPGIRAPAVITEDDRQRLGSPVGFIGHWETASELLMLHLLRNGIRLQIYGHNWERAAARDELRPALTGRTVWGEDYARTVLCFDINLGIVSKQNRSHTATRTFQVPALGGFLLHERNELVSRYYEEGEEIALFGSADELLAKCRHYLAHPEERRRVAAAGQRRCRESGYYETDRVREVIPLLESALRELR